MVIQLSEEQQQRIAQMARERGFDTPAAYLIALVEVDAEEHILDDDFIDDPEEDAIDLEAQFREAWRQAMTGEGQRDAREVLDEIRRELEQDDD